MDNAPDPHAPSDHARLTALEERLSFQQRLIEELNEVLLTHRNDVTRLERQLSQCVAAVERLAASRGGEDDLPHEKPPHY
jgi:SlyX protein